MSNKNKVKALIESIGKSQHQIAKMCGTYQNDVYLWIKKRHIPCKYLPKLIPFILKMRLTPADVSKDLKPLKKYLKNGQCPFCGNEK